MNRTPWYLNERLWAVVAVVGAICCFVSHCNQRADGAEVRTLVHGAVLVIQQSGHKTTGCVIEANPRGTFILTCRHGRTKGDAWTAGPLSGRHTALDKRCDLALLWTSDRWTGPVAEIAATGPDLPLRFIQHPTLPRALPLGCPLYSLDYLSKPGDSGSPLFYRGRVAGVLWGHSPEESLYVQHHAVVRFLMEVQW